MFVHIWVAVAVALILVENQTDVRAMEDAVLVVVTG